MARPKLTFTEKRMIAQVANLLMTPTIQKLLSWGPDGSRIPLDPEVVLAVWKQLPGKDRQLMIDYFDLDNNGPVTAAQLAQLYQCSAATLHSYWHQIAMQIKLQLLGAYYWRDLDPQLRALFQHYGFYTPYDLWQNTTLLALDPNFGPAQLKTLDAWLEAHGYEPISPRIPASFRPKFKL